ncbi:MAG: amidohydrolase family protein [Gammaproteobacteria bacterium]|nr:amidohydrolase family protein [Gammaproteobacteria bacterium]
MTITRKLQAATLGLSMAATLLLMAAELPLKGSREIAFQTDAVTWLSLDVSPDGSTIVMEAVGDLYVLPIEGGTARRITSGMAFDSQPRFSPDGERIVFVSDRSGSENVWIANADGGEPRKLSSDKGTIEFASPSWSPDGTHVVASRTRWGLRTFELWAYHVDGGRGVQITKAKGDSDTPSDDRANALGAVYSPEGRHLYYAHKEGGFAYDVRLPLWQIVRRDLRDGHEDYLTGAQGSGMRPALSPDGSLLAYVTRYRGESGLRLRDLETGEDRWLAYPAQRDDQESRFTRDLFPGYAFLPDGSAVIYTHEGGIRRVDTATGDISAIPFTLDVEQSIGPRLYSPYRLGLGPVKAHLVRGLSPSPSGDQLAFSALARVFVRDEAAGSETGITGENVPAFHPAFSPDGRWLAYVTWAPGGGHIWRVRANGRGTPQRLTQRAAFYSDPAWSPDGERIVALRAASYDRLYRIWDFGEPEGTELVWLPAGGGKARVVTPARGYRAPHFGPDGDRIYVYRSGSWSALTSMRFDGTDQRTHLGVEGPGIYYAEGDVPARDIQISPDGRAVLITHANQLHVARLLSLDLTDVETSIDAPSIPMARLTDVGADEAAWSADGKTIYWTVGNRIYRRALASVEFDTDSNRKGSEKDGGKDSEKDDPPEMAEEHPAAAGTTTEIYLPRHEPEGVLALTGATVISMEPETDPIEDAVIVMQAGRITHVGTAAGTEIPEDASVIDLSGRFVVPGYVDTHAHIPLLQRVFDMNNWALMANLAYGVTTLIDVQPSTVDILAYQDMVDAGRMVGPRLLTTGPGIFNDNRFKSYEHARRVLSRYKDHYRVRNLKSYIAGNREQRQWIVQASEKLGLMPTTEGALDMKLNMTHIIDGFSGNEHNFPVVDLHPDVVQLVARSRIAYTPTLLVAYGGPAAENYFFTRESPANDTKLGRFTPPQLLAARTLRRAWFADSEHVFQRVAAQAAKIIRAGGRVGVGSHGQLQGLGYHWELWALASGGLTPYEALRAATLHGAEMIGIAEDAGTIAPGKLADLVALDADPLVDIRHSDDIAYVVKNGEVFAGDTLDRVWPVAEPLPKQWWQDLEPAP